ncbi:MAG: aminotransferase class V-fold PLP-dependent enzyme [Thermoplasmata archaeon]
MDVEDIRKDFPLVDEYIYFDNACLSLKPDQVVEAVKEYYCEFPVCAGRSSHSLSNELTRRIISSRESIRSLLNADEPSEIVFTKNATESINMVARGLNFDRGDMILSTDKEHNSNLAPWILLKRDKGVEYQQVPSLPDGTFDLEAFEEKINKDVKMVSMVHTSNLDGVTIPAEEIAKIAHDHDAYFMLDAAQSVPHQTIDVKKLDVDFLAFSVHKMLGPTGVGVLYGRKELMEELNPLVVGGGSIKNTSYDELILQPSPAKFEGGLQNYAGICGVKTAVDYLLDLGLDEVEKHEIKLNKLATEGLKDIVKILGPEDPELRSGIFNFNVQTLGCHEISLFLEESKILTRGGMQCVHSWYNKQNLDGGTRVSFYIYNTVEEVKMMVDTLKELLG